MIIEQFVSQVAGTKTISVNKGLVGVSVSGVAAGGGTVELQRQNTLGTWLTVKVYQADLEETIENGFSGRLYRFECTVYGSGTYVCELGG